MLLLLSILKKIGQNNFDLDMDFFSYDFSDIGCLKNFFAIRISILRGRFYDLELDMDSWEFRLLTTSEEIGGQLLHLIARQKSITNSSVRKMGEKNSDYRKKLSY